MGKNQIQGILVSGEGPEITIEIIAERLTRPILQKISAKVRQAVKKRNKSTVRFIFHKCIGSEGPVREVLDLIDQILACGQKGLIILGEVKEFASSAAAYLFIACEICIFQPNARINLHAIQIRSSLRNLNKRGRMSSHEEQRYEQLRSKLKSLLTLKTCMTQDQIERILYQPGDWEIDEQLAEKYCIINRNRETATVS